MQNEKEHTTISPIPSEELYRFGADGNLRMYSYDRLFYSLYGYDGGTTRTYKYSFDLTPNWMNGQLTSVNFNLHNAMFYPNSYINFNNDGYYTKHYYNGMERIASRLGEQSLSINVNDPELQDRKWTGYEFLPVGEEQTIDDPKPVFELPVIGISNLQPSSDGIYYYHPNHLGSTCYVTDENASVVQGFLYAPFGEITNEHNSGFGSSVLPKYSFNAKELDEETGMYYYEARYYAPPVFTSRDALFEEKPWLTPYHYCSNNPVVRVDPTGMMDDWYKSEDGKTVIWQEGNAPSIEIKGETYYNIGENYSYTQGNVTFNYNQNDLVSVTTNVMNQSDYVSQFSKTDWNGTPAKEACNKACDAMLKNVGVVSNSMDIIVNNAGQGRAGSAISNAEASINKMNVNLDLGIPTKINIDYRNGNHSADKMGDHFIVVMGKIEYFSKSGEVTSTSYRYYDPGTRNITKGTASSNILNVINGRLVGTHINNGQTIIATSIRQSKRKLK